MERTLLAVREDQKSNSLKKKSAKVAEADSKDEDGRILTLKMRVNMRRQVQCEVDVIVNRITRLGRVFIRNSDLLQ